ncbi:YeeE/YedE family protein [Methyloradius palustris]|uniref:YeeE/YedE family protein n=1 Tax=Methyloradius palustris TaxID=2778876 RepID=A0A8D5FZ34_9PROT|nr:YeeE/YedE thiosulfate transporter family protein [Methyloradius palustris]BCM24380.1 hypothetical protein ZMTM_06390 [Methyloradius palustris]
MIIDWAHFTPLASLAGGALIGLAAAILVLFNGKIAGVSGILGGLIAKQQAAWRWVFIIGLVISPFIYGLVQPLPSTENQTSLLVLLIAGVLVGIGTTASSGCTSGHGVCGLSRGSLRSLVATLSFMFAGFVAVFIVRHLIG